MLAQEGGKRMGLIQRISEVLGKNKQKSFAVKRGTQQSVDLKSYMMQILNTYEAPEADLELYRTLADNVPILAGAINAYTRMINSGFEILAKSPTVLKKTYEVIDELDLEGTINRIIRQMETYGFCGVEIVLNTSMTEIVKLKVIDGRTLRVQKDQWGNIIAYKQIVGLTTANTSTMAPGAIDLNPELIMFFQRNPEGDSSYGTSLLKTIPFVTSIMLTIEDAIGKIYRRYGSPKYHVSYTPQSSVPDDVMAKRMDIIKDEFGNIDADADFYSNGEINVEVLTPGSGAINFTEELRHIVEQMLSGLGLPAAVLGYNYGSTETHTKEQGMILVSNLKNSQKVIKRVLMNNLFELMARVYNFPEVPQFEWEEIQIRDEYQDAQADEIKIRNVITKRDNGIIDQQQAAVELGYRSSALPEYDASFRLGRYTVIRSLVEEGDIDEES